MSVRVNSSGNDSLNRISVMTYGGRPFGISFACSLQQPNSSNPNTIYRNRDIFNVFMNAINGNSHQDMVGNPGLCRHAGKGNCGNTRGYLWECKCENLDRKLYPLRRLQFENDVIQTILSSPKIVHAQRSGSSFQFNLAIFCSGGLLGEEILLFRLFNELRRNGASGTINLFLIDWEYKDAIGQGRLDQVMDQFLREIRGCLLPSITVSGTFFGDSEDYLQMAANDQFKHDLLIGADLEGAESLMGEIGRRASLSREQPSPIVLIKRVNEAPAICRINPLGEHENCYQPFPPPIQQTRSNVRRQDQPLPPELIAAGAVSVVVVALGIAALVVSSSVNKARR